MAIRVFQLKLTPTYSIYLLTAYYPQKGSNLFILQRLDSYLKSSKFQFPSLTDLCSLYSFIFISFFVKFFVSSKYTKFFIIPDYCQFLHFICLFLYILFIQKKNSPYFYCIQPRDISDKFTIIRDLCAFLLQVKTPLRHFTRNQVLLLPTIKEYINLTIQTYIIPNNWKH